MPYCLGLDIGYSNLKIVHGFTGEEAQKNKLDSDGNRSPKQLILPAGAGPQDKMPTQLSSRDSDGAIHIMLENTPWVAGVTNDTLENWERELHPDYPSTNSYKALFYAALLSTGQSKIDTLVTGLPVSQYLDWDRREALINLLEGTHQITAKQSVEVVNVQVLPQPVGAYMHLVSTVTDEIELEMIDEGKVLVLDPGYFSVDWVAMQNRSLRKESSGTSQKAMSKMLDYAADLICQEYGRKSATREKIENAIRRGKSHIIASGERVPIEDFMERASKQIAPQAMVALREKLREEKTDPDMILIAGGGGNAYKEAAESVFEGQGNRKVYVPSQPVLANAQGFFFYGS